MSTDTDIFDRALLIRKKHRFKNRFDHYNFLHTHALQLICERLDDITHRFPATLYMGRPASKDLLGDLCQKAGAETLFMMDTLPSWEKTDHPSLIGDEEFLPFANGGLDLVIANLDLHQTNDLPGSLIQIRRALKPDGLLIASLFGGETLWQLRETLACAEQKLTGGISPRVHPFADKQQMGALLQRAGYALPVVDSELITVTYPDIFKLMHDLRGMGEGNVIHQRNKKTPPRRLFHEADNDYKQNYRDQNDHIEATFEMMFLIGWSPSETQQKPLRPGSAEKSLAEALGTTEIQTGEKGTP